ncbi:MAG: permease [Bacillota bacterium]
MDKVKRFKWVILLAGLLILALICRPAFGLHVAEITWSNFLYMLKILPPIFIILGLLDVWVPKETMIKFMGEASGFRGGLLAFLLGSAAAGPLYAAFPVAQVLLKKEASLINVYIFIGAWSATKVPPFLFETSTLGLPFALSRLFMIIPAIVIIALLTCKASLPEKEAIYKNAHNL